MLSVLVVEDDEDLGELLRELFEQVGWRVRVERNGTDALTAARGARPDVIVTDGMMPAMGGPELLARLREDAAHAEITVILMSGADSLLRRERESETKTATIRKPFDPEDLIVLIEKLLNVSVPAPTASV